MVLACATRLRTRSTTATPLHMIERQAIPSSDLGGVFPVLPTPFHDTGAPDAEGLARLVRYLLRCGVDGVTYPGVASEVGELTAEERGALTHVVLSEVGGRVPVIVGASSKEPRITI